MLGWEWEMGLNPAGKDALVRQYGVNAHLFNIPREVMDKRAVEAGDVHFFELSIVEVAAHVEGSDVDMELTGFLPAVDDYMRQKVGGKGHEVVGLDRLLVGRLRLRRRDVHQSVAGLSHAQGSEARPPLRPASVPGSRADRRVVVKVIDIFGNDTTHELAVTVGA